MLSAAVLDGRCELVLPSIFVEIEEDEMTYIEGGGTFSIYISKRAMTAILTVSAGAAVGVIAAALSGGNAIIGIVAGAAAALICDYIFNNVYKPKALSKSWTKSWLPNYSFTWY